MDQSVSSSTLKTYQNAWIVFCAYCRNAQTDPYSADVELVLRYLATRNRKVGLSRLYIYSSAISHFYRSRGLTSPCDDARVKMLLKGICEL